MTIKLAHPLFAIVLLLTTACAAIAAPTPTPEPTPTAVVTPVRVAMLADLGGLDDSSFNDLTFTGVSMAARRLNFTFDAQELEDATTYERDVAALAEQDYDIIVTVGFSMTESTLAAAAEHPDIHFIGIDQFQTEPRENVTGIVFADDQAGYLAGVLAANLSESNVIGGIYGPEVVQPVVAFARGYENGAASVNPDIEVLTEFHPSLETGFNDIAWGQEIATGYMDADADVIFAAAGDTGNGALVAVANRTDEQDNLFCIGVDTDQWSTVREARPCLVTSAIKNIPRAVDDVIAQVIDGNPPTGNYIGPVGLAPFHAFEDDIPTDLRDELEQIRIDLVEGTLQTGYTP